MDTLNEILRSLGRIEGEMREIRKLSERVAHLELWQSWLKGWMGRTGSRVRLRLGKEVKSKWLANQKSTQSTNPRTGNNSYSSACGRGSQATHCILIWNSLEHHNRCPSRA